MSIAYHDFDRVHLRTLLPEKEEAFGVVLGQAYRNPDRLNMLLILAIDYAGCLAVTTPDSTNLPRVLRVGAQAAAAVFALAGTAPGECAAVPLGDGPAASYRRNKLLVAPDPGRWLTGFYLAAIVRDKHSKDLLCATPAQLIHSSQVHSPSYFPPLVETLRALHRGADSAREHLTAAQTLLAAEPFAIHEGDVELDLDGPTIELCQRIVDDDYNGFQATLENALLLHRAYWGQDSERRDMPAAALPLGPLAMASLARDRGTVIRVVSDYLLPKLIEPTEAE